MLGPPQTRDLDRPVLIAIESSVPKDHFYRHLHRVLDLAFVRDLAVGCYASDGRPPSIPKSSSASKRWEILEECRLDPERPSGQRVSTTDPDAALMKPRGERACLGYHDHYVVDGGKARIILHALVTPANIMDRGHDVRDDRERPRLRPAARLGAPTPFLRPGAVRLRRRARSLCLPARDAATPVPAGEIMAEKIEHRAEATICNACPLKAACTPSNQGGVVHRSFHAAYLERVQSYHETEGYKKAMRKRKL